MSRYGLPTVEVCQVCVREIRVQIYRGTGVCCGACHDEKERRREVREVTADQIPPGSHLSVEQAATYQQWLNRGLFGSPPHPTPADLTFDREVTGSAQ